MAHNNAGGKQLMKKFDNGHGHGRLITKLLWITFPIQLRETLKVSNANRAKVLY